MLLSPYSSNRTIFRSIVTVFAGVSCLTGCGGPSSSSIHRQAWGGDAAVRRENPVPLSYPVHLGHSAAGRPICATVIGDGPEVVLIMAAIHGNEAAGTSLVQRLETHLMRHAELLDGRRVILLPVANPDGLARNTRHNIHGVDLNRSFPADNFDGTRRHGRTPLSQPESRAIHQLLEAYHPARIVSIHQPLNCIDYDGPAQDLAKAMAERCGLPVSRLGSLPGSLGSYAGLTREIPIVTMELPRAADKLNDDQKWNRYGPALLEAIRFTAVIEAK